LPRCWLLEDYIPCVALAFTADASYFATEIARGLNFFFLFFGQWSDDPLAATIRLSAELNASARRVMKPARNRKLLRIT
jgi:hypothetical protein